MPARSVLCIIRREDWFLWKGVCRASVTEASHGSRDSNPSRLDMRIEEPEERLSSH